MSKMKEILVVCNNICGENAAGLAGSWGLSFLIKTESGEYVLFDTGSRDGGLLHNLKKLAIDIKRVKKIVISHDHWDHTGGIAAILDENPNSVELYFPNVARTAHEEMKALCGRFIPVEGTMRVDDGVFTSGLIGRRIREQGLCIEYGTKLILLLGCAHPGVVKMVRQIHKDFKKDIYAVFGGFHLEYHPKFLIRYFIRQLKMMGVEKISPSHCTGKTAIRLFRDGYKDGFMELGLGDSFSFK